VVAAIPFRSCDYGVLCYVVGINVNINIIIALHIAASLSDLRRGQARTYVSTSFSEEHSLDVSFMIYIYYFHSFASRLLNPSETMIYRGPSLHATSSAEESM
jgi:hypothetical protein